MKSLMVARLVAFVSFLVLITVTCFSGNTLDLAKDGMESAWKELKESIAVKVKGVDVDAEVDIAGYKVRVGAEYGAKTNEIDDLLSLYKMLPSDVLTAYELSRQLRIPVIVVADEYKRNSGNGWGVIAKSLGIKPGSPEFHALKKGEWVSHCDKKSKHKGIGERKNQDNDQYKCKNNGKGKSRGKGKGKGKRKGK
ncbi:MAG: hypothetical protein HQM10_08950 [Candidatus Riflebacteria bacterium]|nr:hypothetical protein [Candidatus Riflebacteria bacterium]